MDNQGGENRTMQKMYLLSGLWLGACRISALAGDVSSVGVGPTLGHSHCPSSQLELGPFFYSPLNLVLVLAGSRANKLGCEEKTLLRNSIYLYSPRHTCSAVSLLSIGQLHAI